MYVSPQQLNGSSSAQPPCADEVQRQVERICQGSDFIHAERLKSFLRYVVDETLAGRSDRLKAYAIALGVFDRTPSFDPQADPIVRIEASRLRRALDHHYLTEGRDDPVVITIPKGSYVPHFQLRQDSTQALQVGADSAPVVEVRNAARGPRAPAWIIGLVVFSVALLALAVALILSRTPGKSVETSEAAPLILVLPFSVAGDAETGSMAGAGLTGALIDRFASSSEVRVMGRETTRWAQSQFSLPMLREKYGLTHILEGDVIARRDGFGISVRLVETRSNSIIWVKSYEESSSGSWSDMQNEIVARTLAKLGTTDRPRNDAAGRSSSQSVDAGWDVYSCKLRFHQYRLDVSPGTYSTVRQCLENAVEQQPRDAEAWAMLSLILVDQLRGSGGASEPRAKILERASQAARRAISVQPDSPRALEALALTLYFSGRPSDGLVAAEKAMAIAPHDAEILGEIGPRVAHAGDWARGRALLLEATTLNPGNAGYYAGHLAFIAYMEGDIAAAASYIARTNRNQFPTRYLVDSLIAAELGQTDRARISRENFLELQPKFIENLDQEIAQRNMKPDDVDRIRRGLSKAGFELSAQP